MESFGFAIADATKAIELDPSYVKAYYRRAISYLAIVKHKDALKDFKAVCKKGASGGVFFLILSEGRYSCWIKRSPAKYCFKFNSAKRSRCKVEDARV
jgi:tetratricopeptide (TPR) repeat protein